MINNIFIHSVKNQNKILIIIVIQYYIIKNVLYGCGSLKFPIQVQVELCTACAYVCMHVHVCECEDLKVFFQFETMFYYLCL